MGNYDKCSKISNTRCRQEQPRHTGQTQIRLLLKKQSDKGSSLFRNRKVFEILETFTVHYDFFLCFQVATVLWWYSLSKVVEFMDTVLMVLRKKQSQVTFLHVYHHASILNVWWIVESFLPGGQG